MLNLDLTLIKRQADMRGRFYHFCYATLEGRRRRQAAWKGVGVATLPGRASPNPRANPASLTKPHPSPSEPFKSQPAIYPAKRLKMPQNSFNPRPHDSSFKPQTLKSPASQVHSKPKALFTRHQTHQMQVALQVNSSLSISWKSSPKIMAFQA